MELAGLPLGLASEGSFGLDPMMGMFPWNVEFLIWIDDGLGLEITGVAQGKTNSAHVLAASWEEVEAFARQAGFPRPESEEDPRIRKGIADWDGLAQAANGCAFIETDMRAHANPTRMENIRLAAEELVKKLRSPCPACATPGLLDRRAHQRAAVRGLRRTHARDPGRDLRLRQVRAPRHARAHRPAIRRRRALRLL